MKKHSEGFQPQRVPENAMKTNCREIPAAEQYLPSTHSIVVIPSGLFIHPIDKYTYTSKYKPI